eukprot:1695180-Alexandrium_andersonii.AAC.1
MARHATVLQREPVHTPHRSLQAETSGQRPNFRPTLPRSARAANATVSDRRATMATRCATFSRSSRT